MQIFWVAAIERRTKKEIDEGTGSDKLLLPPTAIMAKDKDGAILAAGKLLKAETSERTEILVRPF